MILPVSPYAGLIPGKFLYPSKLEVLNIGMEVDHLSAYTSIMNVLDYPSVVIPVTFVDKEVDTIYTNYEPLNQEDKENMDTCESAHCTTGYDEADASATSRRPRAH